MWQERTRMLVGEAGVARLSEAHVLICGLGGVGGMAAEMVARSGVGHMTVVDADTVHESNINRQLAALHLTIGRPKVQVVGERLRQINPNLNLTLVQEFVRDQRLEALIRDRWDVVIDAIDTLSPKTFLIKESLACGLALVSSMGAGARTDPSQVRVSDFWRIRNCHLARHLRKRLRKMGVREHFSAVHSLELPQAQAVEHCEEEQNKKSRVGTISYMPNLFGCLAAAEAIRLILNSKD